MTNQKYVTKEDVNRIYYRFISILSFFWAGIFFIWYVIGWIFGSGFSLVVHLFSLGLILLFIIVAFWANSEANKKKPSPTLLMKYPNKRRQLQIKCGRLNKA